MRLVYHLAGVCETTWGPDQTAIPILLIVIPIELHPGHRRGGCGLEAGDVAIFGTAASDPYCG